MEIRVALEDDLPALEWMGLHMKERDIIRAAFDAQERKEGLMLLGLTNGFPVAQAWLDFAAQGTCAVRVFPPLQGVGLGRALREKAEALAARCGAEAIEIGVEGANPRAKRFYEQRGYEPTGTEGVLVSYAFEEEELTMDVDQQVLGKSLEETDAR